MANRHGLVTGATGTGKTVTLQTMAEAFSQRGVPVFMADVKGDLAGITQPGSDEREDGGAAEGTRHRGRSRPPPAPPRSGTSTPTRSPPRATRCARR